MRPPDIVDADKNAASALVAVDEDPQSQIAALRALEALVHACGSAGASVLAREAARLLEERRATMRAFHLERVERAVRRNALLRADETARGEAVGALEDALLVVGDIDGDAGAVRTLRAQLEEVKAGTAPGKPRPFFARYLEHQKR